MRSCGKMYGRELFTLDMPQITSNSAVHWVYRIIRDPEGKRYQLVCTKRVLDPTTFLTFLLRALVGWHPIKCRFIIISLNKYVHGWFSSCDKRCRYQEKVHANEYKRATKQTISLVLNVHVPNQERISCPNPPKNGRSRTMDHSNYQRTDGYSHQEWLRLLRGIDTTCGFLRTSVGKTLCHTDENNESTPTFVRQIHHPVVSWSVVKRVHLHRAATVLGRISTIKTLNRTCPAKD